MFSSFCKMCFDHWRLNQGSDFSKKPKHKIKCTQKNRLGKNRTGIRLLNCFSAPEENRKKVHFFSRPNSLFHSDWMNDEMFEGKNLFHWCQTDWEMSGTGIKQRLLLILLVSKENTKSNTGTSVINHSGSAAHLYLVVPKCIAFIALPSNTSVADAHIPESLGFQLPVVSPRGEGLDGEDLRPVVETFGMSSARQAVFNSCNWAQVIRDAQQRMSCVCVQTQGTGYCKERDKS